jgi:hypothetical protein
LTAPLIEAGSAPSARLTVSWLADMRVAAFPPARNRFARAHSFRLSSESWAIFSLSLSLLLASAPKRRIVFFPDAIGYAGVQSVSGAKTGPLN